MKSEIIKPIIANGNIGFDRYDQCIHYRQDDSGHSVITHIADVRLKTCTICGKGWQLTEESLVDQFRCPITEEWVHKSCYVGHLAMTEATMWYNLLCATDFLFDKPQKIENQYKGAWNTPWYEYPIIGLYLRNNPAGDRILLKRTLTVGRRKRVWHIEIQLASDNPWRDLEIAWLNSMFDPVKSTKGFGKTTFYVHAWDETDCKLLLMKIWAALCAAARNERVVKRPEELQKVLHAASIG